MRRKAYLLGIILLIVAGFVLVVLLKLLTENSAPALANLPTVVATAVQPPTIAAVSTVKPSTRPTSEGNPFTPEPTAEPTATNPAIIIHVVQSEENLFRIALKYGVPVESIAALNGINDPSLVYAGQQIAIPQPVAIVDPASQPLALVSSQAATETLSAKAPTTGPPPLLPPPTTINGLPFASFFSMPPETMENVSQILARGLEMGRNPRAFSKVGDSTIENPYFLTRFDGGPYNLGEYIYLQPVIEYFAGSYGRQGMAVRRGLHSWTVTDPVWADKTVCLANESPLACEIRLHNPSVLLIRLGSNDAGVPEGFRQNMRQVVEIALSNGVIPVLGTKADRFEGGDNINNNILRQIAAEYSIPLWDFDIVAGTIPGRGLDVDYVHMTTFYAHDYSSVEAFLRGHSVHNLTALIVLDILWREIIQPVMG